MKQEFRSSGGRRKEEGVQEEGVQDPDLKQEEGVQGERGHLRLKISTYFTLITMNISLKELKLIDPHKDITVNQEDEGVKET